MPQNYLVKIASFRPYVHGNVIPDWVAGPDDAARERLVARGVLEPTAKPVNCPLAPPPPSAARDASPDVIADLNRHRERAEREASRAESWEKLAKEYERDRERLKRVLADKELEIAHLTEACETHQARIAELEKELEQATAPAA